MPGVRQQHGDLNAMAIDPLSEVRRRNSLFRKNLIIRITPQEAIVKKFLEERGVRFLFQHGMLKPFHRIVDFYIPGSKTKRLIIEIDGGYHMQSDIVVKDANKDRAALEDRKCRTLRISNKQVNGGEFKSIILNALTHNPSQS